MSLSRRVRFERFHCIPPFAKDKLFLASTITINFHCTCVFLLEILASRPNQALPAKSTLDAFLSHIKAKIGTKL